MNFLGPKAVDILRMAAAADEPDRYVALQGRAIERHKAKPIDRKCDELYARGYLSRDPARFHGFRLTAKGERALGEHLGDPLAAPLTLTRTVLEEIARSVGQVYPEEGCGMLLRGAEGDRVLPCENVQAELHAANPKLFPKTGEHAYAIGPADIQRLKQQEALGWRLAVIYHSHVESPPVFSADDARKATLRDGPLFPGVDYLVLGISRQDPPPEHVGYAAVYRWNPGARDFLPVRLALIEPVAEPELEKTLTD